MTAYTGLDTKAFLSVLACVGCQFTGMLLRLRSYVFLLQAASANAYLYGLILSGFRDTLVNSFVTILSLY